VGDRERHPIAVKICARKRNFPGGIERGPEREGPSLRSRPRFHITKQSRRLQDRDPAKDLFLLNRRLVAPAVSKLIEFVKF
jgi:hypothetical protein